MANAIYEAYKQEALGDADGPGHGTVDWETPGGNGIKALLVDTADYFVNTATDQDHTDVTGAGIVATSSALTCTVALSSGTATIDASDWTWSAVSGDQSEAVVIYKDSGVSATSLLIIYYDTFASGMPVSPNGGDINATVNASGLWTW